MDDDTAEVIVERPGSHLPVDGISIRLTPEEVGQLVVLADLSQMAQYTPNSAAGAAPAPIGDRV